MNTLPVLLYLLLVIPAALIWYAQSRVRRVFQQADQIENAERITGYEAARELLDRAGLNNVRVEVWQGLASDHYDPATKILRLTPRIARHESTLAVGVAAHEVGHAIQDAEGYSLMRFRNRLARWVLVASTLSPIAFIGGLFLGNLPLLFVAVGILALQVVFALVNLPLEKDASRRAVRLLEERGLILQSERGGVKRVLGAASFTYLASVGVRLSLFLFWFIVFASLTNLGSRL